MSITKKIRFEVFKRDGFKCQYCGKTPPCVMLEVDHIQPKSKKGIDDINNLITACFDCNRGKTNIELKKIPASMVENAEIILEKESQYKEYKKVVLIVERRLNKEAGKIDELFKQNFPEYNLTEGFKNTSVKKFLKELGFSVVYSAMETACYKVRRYDVPKYFCGICWNIIKNK
jgi:CRISPR/Cas system Type II protein with McrA/HNH and RuvC-like nuclease domain